MKTSDMMSSKYLRKEDVGAGALATIREIKKENLAREDDTPEFKFTMYFEEYEKGLVLNSTNIQLAEKVLDSDDTEDWIGKQIVLYEDPNVSYGGKLVGGIRIRAVRRKAAAAVQPKPKTTETVAELEDDIPF